MHLYCLNSECVYELILGVMPTWEGSDRQVDISVARLLRSTPLHSLQSRSSASVLMPAEDRWAERENKEKQKQDRCTTRKKTEELLGGENKIVRG